MPAAWSFSQATAKHWPNLSCNYPMTHSGARRSARAREPCWKASSPVRALSSGGPAFLPRYRKISGATEEIYACIDEQECVHLSQLSNLDASLSLVVSI